MKIIKHPFFGMNRKDKISVLQKTKLVRENRINIILSQKFILIKSLSSKHIKLP